MNKTQIAILSTGIPILLIIMGLLSYMILSSHKQSKNYKKIEHILVYTSSTVIQKSEVILNRISIIKRKNKDADIAKVFDKLSSQYDDIKRKYGELVEKIRNLKVDYKKMKSKELKLELEFVEELKLSIQSRVTRFKKQSEKITQQEDFLRNEFTFYRSNLNQVLQVYAKKRILLDKISPKIDLVNDQIKAIDEKFISNLEKANIEKASELVEEYRGQILILAKAINEGAKIQVHLYKIVPKQIAELIRIYKNTLKQLNVDLGYLNFKETIKKLSDDFKLAKESFLNIQIEKSKSLVIKILKNIKVIERMINLEIKARNLYMKNYNEVLKLTRSTLRKYVSIRKYLKENISAGEGYSYELGELKTKIKKEAAILDNLATSYKEVIKNKEIPFTSKLSRTKILMNKGINCLILVNEILSILWRKNAKKVELKNKYLKIDSALNDIQEVQKIEKIVLSKKEMLEMNDLIEDKNKLLDKLSQSNINVVDIQYDINTLTEFVSSHYKVVMGKSKMALMIKNLIKEFGFERAENQSLNIALISAERKYMEGDYVSGLNLIIQGLEERMKNV